MLTCRVCPRCELVVHAGVGGNPPPLLIAVLFFDFHFLLYRFSFFILLHVFGCWHFFSRLPGLACLTPLHSPLISIPILYPQTPLLPPQPSTLTLTPHASPLSFCPSHLFFTFTLIFILPCAHASPSPHIHTNTHIHHHNHHHHPHTHARPQ